MLNTTSLLAPRILLHLGTHPRPEPTPPRRLAAKLHESPTYLARVSGLPVRAGIVRAHRGAMGGIVLSREPASVTLLSIVQACQGPLRAGFCRSEAVPAEACAYHHAALELHHAIAPVISRWSLAQLLARAVPGATPATAPCCFETAPPIDFGAAAATDDSRRRRTRRVRSARTGGPRHSRAAS
jgi:Rrf2 family protein